MGSCGSKTETGREKKYDNMNDAGSATAIAWRDERGRETLAARLKVICSADDKCSKSSSSPEGTITAVVATPPDENAKEIMESVLGSSGGDPNLIRHILSFMVPPENLSNTRSTLADIFTTERAKKQVAEDIQSCLSVCKLWNIAMWENMTPSDGIPGVLSHKELVQLKKRIVSIELFFLGQELESELEENISKQREYMQQQLRERLDVQQFTAAAIISYKQFLLVKAIEFLAERKQHDQREEKDEATTADIIPPCWLEKCQATAIIDKMWHEHMLSPQKYHADCHLLAEGIIDHQRHYLNPRLHEGSDYPSKLQLVCGVEKTIADRHSRGRDKSYRRRLEHQGNRTVEGFVKAFVHSINMETCCG
mmetsp:Transcript_16631/g.31213  ORF Transcript_16631/g.31213 Transcript_16631/m.31213 type:complete len:366 (-) Transcript_16631:32-1129(-)|eukprot:CAMPEP_0197450844 /NCGR_PEP_ID=MMETSP1175-20131217/26760_1 /TAXON_ID=1003142 /ORGANISM="Triceratium dubium, Strain CCMP147" /LENGTH=365 /DNA_ID=CAMNT_0042983369 /DNA_START=78 /DNA_END=1178 /DNA_ORIENTATION=-